METASYVVGALAVVAGIVAGVFLSTSHRDWGIWVSGVAITLVVWAGVFWFLDRLSRQDEEARKSQSSAVARGDAQGLLNIAAIERPWLFLENLQMSEPKAGENIELKMNLRNSGNAPAVLESWNAAFVIADTNIAAQELTRVLEERRANLKTTDPMNAPIPAQASNHFSGVISGTPITDAEFQTIEAGTQAIFVCFWATYADSTGAKHETEERFRYHSKSRALEVIPGARKPS